MNSTIIRVKLAILLISVAVALGLLLRGFGSQAQNMATPAGADGGVARWRPGSLSQVFAGANACTKCHQSQAAKQHATSMGRALESVEVSEVLRSHAKLNFTSGPFTYRILRDGTRSIYSTTDGKDTISEPILYSFGQGKAGQTYVFKHNGSFYESRVSYFRETDGLDWTIGYARETPPSLEAAIGRPVSIGEIRDCFGCHSTGAVVGQQLYLERMVPGVSCEACHGPGGEHVALMEAKQFKDKRIFNPGHLSADELAQEFCGSCHRSAEQVSANPGLRGLTSIRFQPYRLFTSKGHDPFDSRLTCTACHDPHTEPEHDLAFYDSNCFLCHHSSQSLKSIPIATSESSVGRVEKACPVGQKLCVTCHMPKVDLPGAHFRFTDHRIRIVKPGEAFPN